MKRVGGLTKPFLDEEVFNVLRKKKGMTLSQVAKASGYYDKSSITALLRGESKPSKAKAEKMASVLGCYVDTLLISPDRVSEEKREAYSVRIANTRKAYRAYEQKQKEKQEKFRQDAQDHESMSYKEIMAEFKRLGEILAKVKED